MIWMQVKGSTGKAVHKSFWFKVSRQTNPLQVAQPPQGPVFDFWICNSFLGIISNSALSLLWPTSKH